MTDAFSLRRRWSKSVARAGLLLMLPMFPLFADMAAGVPGEQILDASHRNKATGAQGPSELERLRVAKRAQAFQIDFFAPFYSIEYGRDTVLFLMNRISEPIVVDLAARSGGRELALGSYPIEPLRHVEISLRDALGGLQPEFVTGSLRLSFLGDEETLQAWAVHSGQGGQGFEIPFQTRGGIPAREFYAFWDVTPLVVPGWEPVAFHFLNSSERELSLSLVAGQGPRRGAGELRLPPGETARWSSLDGAPLERRGWLSVRHDGEPGDLLGLGVVGAKTPVGMVSLIPDLLTYPLSELSG